MTDVILASVSPIRRYLLENAGVAVTALRSPADEEMAKVGLRAENATVDIAADTLAELKAIHVAHERPAALVIGSDQILECDGVWFDKPADMVQARTHLQTLRGKTHRLVSSAVIVKGRERLWSVTESAELTMRVFTDAFLDDYRAAEGEEILKCVGAYRLEGRGAQLFSKVCGDHFTVLGLPLLPVLGYLRNCGVLMS